MNLVKLGEGVFRLDAGTDYFGNLQTTVSYFDIYRLNTNDVRELYISPQFSAIGDRALPFQHLERLHLPTGIRKLGHAIFFYCMPERGYIEVIYQGTSGQFAALATPFREEVRIEEAGEYDRQPYCITQDTEYRYEVQERRFDASVAACRVLCADGVTLYYGYKERTP